MSVTTVQSDVLKAYVSDLLAAYNVDEKQCRSVADNMVWSELVGRKNFGVSRIPIHIKRIQSGVLNPNCKPVIKKLAVNSAQVNADNGFGYYAGELAMQEAISLAENTGIGIVGVNNSNFYGTGAYFVNLAAKAGMLSFAFSNSFPKVVAFGGSKSVLGTNPIAFGAPRSNNESLMVDFATSSLAGSTVREYLQNGELLPENLAILPNGDPLTDPKRVGEGSLMPFGGAKGYGLSLIVEILAGILTGSGFSHSVKSTYSNFKEKSNSGHMMIAIDIRKWMTMDEYYLRFESLINLIKISGVQDNILLPGEHRWENYKENIVKGIEIDPKIKKELEALSSIHGITPPW